MDADEVLYYERIALSVHLSQLPISIRLPPIRHEVFISTAQFPVYVHAHRQMDCLFFA